MANDWLAKFIPLCVDTDGVGVALTGTLGAAVARVVDGSASPSLEPSDTHFTLHVWSREPGEPPLLARAMTVRELRQLAVALTEHEHHVRTTIDATLFLVFLQQIDAELAQTPSRRFAEVVFDRIAADEDGKLVAHFSMNDIVIGTIHDARGAISIEQHVVPLPVGRLRCLRRADRLSLAHALDAFIGKAKDRVDPLWKTLARDAAR